MLIVGELINASRKSVAEAIKARDAEAIIKLAADQKQAGADFIDVNAGVFVEDEPDHLKWLVTTVQGAIDAPCCIDSPNPEAISAALEVHKGRAMVNSISLEKDRFDKMAPMVADAGAKVVALCMSDEGMPETKDQRLAIAEKLIGALNDKGLNPDDLYVDPLVPPLGANDKYGIEFLAAIDAIMTNFDGVHTIAGMSNISFGLPERKLLNQAFMIMAITNGLDAAIANPLDRRMMANITVANALAGKDEYCQNLIAAYRKKKLELS